MSLYRRKGSKYWWCKITWSGETVRETTRTTSKSQARVFEDRLRQRIWEAKQLGKTAYTWDAAAEQWLEESSGKRSLYSDESIIAWFQPHLTGKRLTEIDRAKVDELRALKLAEASQATVNRHMALLRSILRRARDHWEVVSQIPSIPMYTSNQVASVRNFSASCSPDDGISCCAPVLLGSLTG